VITYVRGSLFTSPAPVLVNTVNLVGVMGKGIAKEFKEIFPEMFREYQELCESNVLQIGTLHYWRGPGKSVLNFPTKRHWRAKSKIEDIQAGLSAFVANYDRFSIRSIAFPQLGCGNGELDWERQVRPEMEKYLGPLPIEVYIHIYDRGAEFIEQHRPEEMRAWLRTEPESLSFPEVWADLVGNVVNMTNEDTGGEWSITVRDSDDDRGIEFRQSSNEEAEFIGEDELMSIWSQLRSFGLLGISDLPSAIARPLGELLQSLPYIEPVEFNRGTSSQRRSVLFDEDSTGYRLGNVAESRAHLLTLAQKSLI
jgi:O-acetyl-ADP-ribose deacetylase (regulator of RNase III)